MAAFLANVAGCVSANNSEEFILIKVELFHKKVGTRTGCKIVRIYFDGVIPMVVVIKPYRYWSINRFAFLSYYSSMSVSAFMALKLQKVNVMASTSGIRPIQQKRCKDKFLCTFYPGKKWFNKPFNFSASIRLGVKIYHIAKWRIVLDTLE